MLQIFKIYRKLEIQQLIIKHKSVSLSKDLNINVYILRVFFYEYYLMLKFWSILYFIIIYYHN